MLSAHTRASPAWGQPWQSPYLGSILRMRNAGLVSDRRSRFTGHSFSWEEKLRDQGTLGLSGTPIPTLARPALTQQRMTSQRAEEGASVFTAFLQAWESETRKPAWRRADLETKRGRGWPGGQARVGSWAPLMGPVQLNGSRRLRGLCEAGY